MELLKIGAVWCPRRLVMQPRRQKIESQSFDQGGEIIEKYQTKSDQRLNPAIGKILAPLIDIFLIFKPEILTFG